MADEPSPRREIDGREEATFVVLAKVMYDGTGARPVPDPALLLRGDRILGVESRGPGWRMPSAARQLTVPEGAVIPGLIDPHVHLAGVQSRDDGATVARAVGQAQRALAAGITTVRDCGGPSRTILDVRAAVQLESVTGPRVLSCGAPLTTTAGHCHWMGGRADSADELKRRVRQLRELDVDFVKIMLTGGMSTPHSNPRATQYSLAEAEAAVEDSHRLGLRVAAHVLNTKGVEIAVRAGVDTIEHGWTITGRPQGFEPQDAELMSRAGYPVALDVTAHRDLQRLTSQPDGIAELRRRLWPHRTARELGIPVIASSDADGEHTAIDAFARTIEAYRLGMEVSFESALHAVTQAAAIAIGLGEMIGSLTPGHQADMVVLGGDPGVDRRAMEDVRHVLLAGHEVITNGGVKPASRAAPAGR